MNMNSLTSVLELHGHLNFKGKGDSSGLLFLLCLVLFVSVFVKIYLRADPLTNTHKH